MAEQTTKLNIAECGVSVDVGSSGPWLTFKTKRGDYASFNVAEMIDKLLPSGNGGVRKNAMNGWFNDRLADSKQINEENK